MDNINIPNDLKKSTVEKNPAALKSSVKTIYLDTGENVSRMRSLLGIIFLFFCIFAVCIGLVLCLSDSFSLELNMLNIALVLFISILFFTFIYFLPSKFFTVLGFILGAGGFAFYFISNLNYIIDAAYYTLNLGLYRINQEGYIIGSIIDYDLAKTVNETTAGYINNTAVLFAIIIAAIFSYLVYSKKNVAYSLIISIAIVFPGFFYGLIPEYFSFSLVAAFWVSQFAINMFESTRMAYIIGKENFIPDKKLAKYKLKMFKNQYKQNIKSIKSEIKSIVKSPNRNENSIRLDKLLRQLSSVSKSNWLFLTFYGLNDPNSKYSKQSRQSKKSGGANKNIDKTEQKTKQRSKTNFINQIKAEKHRLAAEIKENRAAEKAALKNQKNEFAQKAFSERIKIKFASNFKAKKKYSIKSGYAGIFAFIIAFFAITAVQPFIAPQAKFDLSMPEKIMNFLTSTVEYTLVGSDSSVYGGYNGGMGGGFLYRPGGAKFKDKPILKITSATNSNYVNLKSGVIYLKGWTGTIYTGNMWQEADKKQIDEYNTLAGSSVFPRSNYIGEKTFFKTFTENMQDMFAVSYQRRGAELKGLEKIKIEHLVSGGKRSFLPYFYENYDGGDFKFKANADLSVQITNSLFRYPVYITEFYSVDNILNRASVAVEDLKEYLDFYYSRSDISRNIQDVLTRIDPVELKKLIPDIRYVSRNQYTSMSERSFDQMLAEGKFYEYSELLMPYEDIPASGYIYIPDKYDETIDIIKVRYNVYNFNITANIDEGGIGNFINSDFIDSEVLYNKFVRGHYLSLPDDFPQEVKDLAEEITAGLNSDYEKALAIEQYLAKNYTYTLNPITPLNTKRDFVYNFLLDTKEGYCTAYASAMVTMLRTLGIPARYSEGYLVDTSKKQKDEYGKEYIIIYDYNGHAWPEVYLRGIGWLPFEPTVSYNEEEEKEAEPYVYTPPARMPEWNASMTTSPADEEDDEDILTDQAESLPAMFYVILAVILVCILIYVLNILIVSQKFKNFKSAKTNAAVMKMLAYILVFLKHCGFVMHNEEGLKEFAKRVSPNFATISPEGWDQIAEIMQKSRYSTHEITESERIDVYDFLETLRKECLKRLKFNLKFKLQYVYFML